jgi:hypothetical protein
MAQEGEWSGQTNCQHQGTIDHATTVLNCQEDVSIRIWAASQAEPPFFPVS